MQEVGLTKNQIIQVLTRSPHGDLRQYVATMTQAMKEDPEFVAHLIAWNYKHGQIRDAHVALPTISLAHDIPNELKDNSLAHLAVLDPKNLLRGVEFYLKLTEGGKRSAIKRLVRRYLRVREDNWPWWEKTALSHRASLKGLYALMRVKPKPAADLILFKRKYPAGCVFDLLKQLPTMSPTEAAGTILERKLPFLPAMGALKSKAKDPTLLMALIDRMSPTQLVTNTKHLERLGVTTSPTLRAAFEKGLEKAAKSKKTTFKATKAAKAVGSKKLKEKVEALQEKQLDNIGIDGNWLILGDRSGSMQHAIEATRKLAAALARMVKGKVHVIFFNTSPQYHDMTGLTYEEIQSKTALVRANGGTSIGCGLAYALYKNLEVDGICIVTDCGENTPPFFADAYKKSQQLWGKDAPIYIYEMGDNYGYNGAWAHQWRQSMASVGIDVETFDLTKGFDEYSLPNIAQTMRAERWSLTDQIMEVPLMTLEDAFKPEAMGRV